MKLKLPLLDSLKNVQILILRLAVILGIYIFLRFFFLILNNSYFFDRNITELLKIFYYGLFFDLSAIAGWNFLFIVLCQIPFSFRQNKNYQKGLLLWFYISNIAAFILNLIDIEFFRFQGRRSTSELFGIMATEGEIADSIPNYIKDFWFLLVLLFICILVLLYLNKRINKKALLNGLITKKGMQSKPFNTKSQSLIFIGVIAITIILYRGGLRSESIDISTASHYVQSNKVVLLLNTPFCMMKSYGHNHLVYKNYMPQEQALNIFNPVVVTQKNDTSAFKPINVVIIIMESFSSEYIGSMNPHLENGKYKGYTPFLDSLIKKSLLIRGFASNKRSIEGIPSILSSMPQLMNEPFLCSKQKNNKINSIASLLKKKGYSTAFFHGGSNGAMSLDQYTTIAGFDKYYGRNEYNNEADYDGVWGISDEPYFQYFCKEITKMKEPFAVSVFSISSHHPYKLPKKYKNVFTEGKLPIHRSVLYADFALKRFFESAKKTSWYKNTLFVITADHASEPYYSYYKTRMGTYEIPIIFYQEGKNLKNNKIAFAQQTDIMPSILEYMNYDLPYVSFGVNFFNPNAKGFFISYADDTYQLYKDGYVLHLDKSKAFAIYHYSTDSLLNKNLLSLSAFKAMDLEKFAKAYIQVYNNSFLTNRLTAE